MHTFKEVNYLCVNFATRTRLAWEPRPKMPLVDENKQAASYSY